MTSPIRRSAAGKPHPKRGAPAGPIRAPRPSGSANRIPIWKKTLFSLVTVVIFFGGVESLLTLVGVRVVRYEADPFVGFSSHVPLFVEQTTGGGERVLVTAPNKRAYFNRQQFPAQKAAGTYRIFCVGGSTTYGRPYDDRTSFCGWLREMLADAAPDRQCEVINAGGISYASYRVAVVMEELIRYSPDLFIIYSGHNEFLERRTYANILDTPAAVRSLSALLSHTRTYSAIHQVLLGGAPRPAEETHNLLPAEVDALLDRSIGPADYSREQLQTPEVIAHYRFNLVRMIEMARSVGAEVILVTPASNLQDCSPFKSQHRSGLSAAQKSDWEALVEAARGVMESGVMESGGMKSGAMKSDDDAEALSKWDAAIEIDDQYAHTHFWRGQVLMRLGRTDEARTAFTRARREDVCPLRAMEAIHDVVMETARSYEVDCVDFVSLVEAKSAHQLPGAEWFLDHVHPTIEGNRLLALALLDTLPDVGPFSYAASWNDQAAQRVTDRVLGSLDRQSDAMALRNLAKVLGWAGKAEESERLARQATEIEPRDAESHYMVGVRLAVQQRDADALLRFENALQIKPDYAEAHYSAAHVMQRLGRSEEAIAHYGQALQIKPDYAEAHVGWGLALRGMGRAEEAIDHYRQALQIVPGDAPAHHNLGIALQELRRWDEAVAHYQYALKSDPDDADVHNNLGTALEEMHRWDEAVTHYRHALRINPRLAEAHYHWASGLQNLGRYLDATVHYEQALRINPDFPVAHNGLANALQAMSRTEDALTHYEAALRSKPDYAEAHNNLGSLLQGMGRLQEAVAHFERALQIQPTYAEAAYNWGVTLHGQGLVAQAADHYRQALRIEPEFAQAHHNLGAALQGMDRADEAIAHFQQALRIRPDYAEAHINWGNTLRETGQFEQAARHYQTALQIRPGLAAAAYHWGVALATQGRLAEAAAKFEQALQLKPAYPDAQNNLRRAQALLQEQETGARGQ